VARQLFEERVEEMSVKIHAEIALPTTYQIDELELKLGHKIPSSYRGLLIENGAATFDENVSQTDDRVSVLYFLGLSSKDESSLFEITRTYEERFPKGYLPVACCEGGNFLLIKLADSSVWFWDHEEEAQEDNSSGIEACTRLSSSLDDFLLSLKKPEPIVSTAEILSVKINPEFAAKFGLKIPK
jgi:hypothetical protein